MHDPIVIQRLPGDAISRLAEVDRSEHVTCAYRAEDGRLVAAAVDWQVPAWTHDGDGEHSVRGMLATWRPVVDAGGELLGALDGACLAGLALLRPQIRPGVAQLALLFVSRPYRRRGVARRLIAEVARLAHDAGAGALYVSATPSGSAVGFYLAQGFALAVEPLPELFAKEPEDIHMLMPLI